MRPALSRHNTEVLLDMAVGNQGDVLGYHDFGGGPDGDDEGDNNPVSEDCRLFLAELGRDALGGSQEGVTRHVLKWPTLKMIDTISADILTGMGIDPACALAIHDALGKRGIGIEIVDADADDAQVVVEDNLTGWIFQLEENVAWNSIGMLKLPPLPDSVASAMAGEPLSRIFSHPAFDGHELIVREVQPGEDFITVYLAEVIYPTLTVRDIVDRRRLALAKAA